MRKSSVTVLLSVVLVGAAGCAKMTVEEKYAHLRDVAEKGADAHFVLVNENKQTTAEVCDQHYSVFVVDGAPAERGDGNRSAEWIQLSKDYFRDSCVKGEPREIQTRSATPSSTSAPSSTSPSSSAAQGGS